jgi:hypothetical protein
MKMCGGMDIYIHIFLTLALVGGEWSASCPCCFALGTEHLVPIGYEAGWAPEPVWKIWRSENILSYCDSNSESLVCHSVVSCYAVCVPVALSTQQTRRKFYNLITWKCLTKLDIRKLLQNARKLHFSYEFKHSVTRTAAIKIKFADIYTTTVY